MSAGGVRLGLDVAVGSVAGSVMIGAVIVIVGVAVAVRVGLGVGGGSSSGTLFRSPLSASKDPEIQQFPPVEGMTTRHQVRPGLTPSTSKTVPTSYAVISR